MIGIIGAMPQEIETIKSEVENLSTEIKGIRTFYSGTIHNVPVVIVLAGIGKVNAAITTTLLLEYFDVSHVVNIGVAGGQNGVSHKHVVISDEVLYHDVDVTKFSTYEHGQIPGSEPTFKADQSLLEITKNILETMHISYTIGKIASGDQFVYKKETIEKVNELYPDIFAIEMEAGAIAHTCSLYNKPFIIYRSISDVLEDENQHLDFDKFVSDASYQATRVLLELLQKLS